MFKLAASVVWSIKATRSMLEHVKNTYIGRHQYVVEILDWQRHTMMILLGLT